MPQPGKLGYGLDDPSTVIGLAVVGVACAVAGLLISVYTVKMNMAISRVSIIAGPSVGFLVLAAAVGIYWSNTTGKIREVERVFSDLPWGGGETTLDIGCGRGLAGVKVARRLPKGYAVGVDLWKSSHVWGNSSRSARRNADNEGVGERVVLVKGSPNSLPFADSSFDAVVSAGAIHRFAKGGRGGEFFTEVKRVLKEGGRIGFFETGGASRYSTWLRMSGMEDIETRTFRFSSFPPFQIVVARKPFGS